jgi:hypothetical protein
MGLGERHGGIGFLPLLDIVSAFSVLLDLPPLNVNIGCPLLDIVGAFSVLLDPPPLNVNIGCPRARPGQPFIGFIITVTSVVIATVVLRVIGIGVIVNEKMNGVHEV